MPYQGASMNHENIQRIIFYILILLENKDVHIIKASILILLHPLFS